MNYNESRKIYEDLRKWEADVPAVVAEMGTIAQNHSIMSFRDQGFTDERLVKWRPRKRTWYRTRSGKYVDDTTRGILIGKGTGNLRKIGRRKIGKYTTELYNNPVTNDYAKVHNDGLRSGRGAGFKMPKRQFMGYSKVMDQKIIRMINRHVTRNMGAAA